MTSDSPPGSRTLRRESLLAGTVGLGNAGTPAQVEPFGPLEKPTGEGGGKKVQNLRFSVEFGGPGPPQETPGGIPLSSQKHE